MQLIYLASPLSSSSKVVRESRIELVQEFLSAYYMSSPVGELHALYSPIAQYGPVAETFDMPHEFSFWSDLDLFMIKKSKAVWVLPFFGAEDSKGIAQEIKYCHDNKIPVFVVGIAADVGLFLTPCEGPEQNWLLQRHIDENDLEILRGFQRRNVDPNGLIPPNPRTHRTRQHGANVGAWWSRSNGKTSTRQLAEKLYAVFGAQ